MAVAHDYAFILHKAMTSTRKMYSTMVGDKVRDQTAYTVKDDKWMQCESTNMTYVDCPISLIEGKSDVFSMGVAVHNPSSIDKHHFNILVPKGQYVVEKFQDAAGALMDVPSVLRCKLDDLNERYETKDHCSLEVANITLLAKTVSLFNITRYSTVLAANQVEQNGIIRLPNSDMFV